MLESLVRDRLRDPRSAEFGSMNVSRNHFEIRVCGGVNSKNSFGAYVGLRPFFMSVRLEPLEVEQFLYAANTDDIQRLIDYCLKEGIDISMETFP